MKKKVLLFLLLALLFSFSSTEIVLAASLDSLVYKLEQDLKESNGKVVERDVRDILKIKEELPVIHVPELNYLTGKEIELLPSTELSTWIILDKVLQPFKVYSLSGLLILSLFSVLFFFQQNRKFNYAGRVFSAVFGAVLVYLIFREQYLFLLFFFAVAGAFLFSFRKRRLLFLYCFLFVMFFLSVSGERFLEERITSPQETFVLKVNRDWYAPDYLVDAAFKSSFARKVEKVTNRVCWGNYTVSSDIEKLLKEVKSKDEKAILLNDLGVISFMNGKLREAKSFFLKALKVKSFPIIEYNLLLTRSALLDTSINLKEAANKVGNLPFITKGIPIPFHLVPERISAFKIMTPYVLSFILGVGVGVLILKLFSVSYGYFKEDILKIPFSVNFVNAELKPFIVWPLFVTVLNLLWGIFACN